MYGQQNLLLHYLGEVVRQPGYKPIRPLHLQLTIGLTYVK
jgi:hypothetical protein